MTRDNEILKRRSFYNITANLVWTTICVAPIFIFCYKLMPLKWLYIFLAISLTGVFLSKSFFRKLHIGKSGKTYQKIGIKFIKKFTQNGDIVNNLVKKKYPDFKVITRKQSTIRQFSSSSLMFEKFHFIGFIFFLLTTIYALHLRQYWWAVVITITNIIYNVYPVFLQQYLRIRISAIERRSASFKS